MYKVLVIALVIAVVLAIFLGVMINSKEAQRIKAEGKAQVGLIKANAWAEFLADLAVVLTWALRIITILGVAVGAVWAARKWVPGLFSDMLEVLVEAKQTNRRAMVPVTERHEVGPWIVVPDETGRITWTHKYLDPRRASVVFQPDGKIVLPEGITREELAVLVEGMTADKKADYDLWVRLAQVAVDERLVTIVTKMASSASRAALLERVLGALMSRGHSYTEARKLTGKIVDHEPIVIDSQSAAMPV
ncbi:MAG: hypothetical protein Q8N84_00650 [bacterium]|nr:hypothetical protein [bacterium]